MKFVCRVLPAALLFGVTTVMAADPAADRAEAAVAFDSGDYARAVQLYSRTREAAAAGGDDRTWVMDTLALARAHLRAGVPDSARQLLAELERRSGSDVGTLPGEILVAEGRIAEAKAFFRRLLAASAADAKRRGEAELALTYLQALSGDKKELAEALKTLERLERDADFAAEARLRRIYTLIRAGRPKEALELAGRTRADGASARRRLEVLRLSALLHAGAFDEFDAGWSKARKEILPRPDKLAFDMLVLAAEKASQSPHPEWAVRYLEDAYGFADRDEVRRDVLRKLFNCCARIDPPKAVEVAKRYVEAFPASGADAAALTELADVLTETGRLLGNAGKHQEALKFFKMVVDDSRTPPSNRRNAMIDAAAAAEKLDDHAVAKFYFESLLGAPQTPRQLQQSQILYAGYLIRRGDLPGAERLLRGISGVTDPNLKDEIRMLLVRVLAGRNDFAGALREADELRHSADRKNAGFGEYYGAVMADKLGRADARERYLAYCKHHPKGEFVRNARFSAAKLAEKRNDYAAAAREFFAYGEEYSKFPEAGSALFWALRAACLSRDLETAVKAFAAIRRVTGVGAEYYAAVLQLTDFMRRNGRAAEASEILNTVDRSKCIPAQSAMLDLMRAKLLDPRRRRLPAAEHHRLRTEAIKAAEQLLNDYPNESAAADAAYLAGELYLDGEDPEKALEMMRRVRDRHPNDRLGDAAAALAADCRLKLYDANNSPAELETAAEEFKRLADSGSTDPGIRLMCKYKLGRCREKQNDPREAVKQYQRTLVYARELKRSGRTVEPKWCSLSAYAALNLLLNHSWPDADRIGSTIIRMMKQLELPGGDAECAALKKKFDEVRKEFKKRRLKR